MEVNVARLAAAILGRTSLREAVSQVAERLERWFRRWSSPAERQESDPCPDRIPRERERIARELHDTLFQGFLSSLQLHRAVQHAPSDSPSKASLSYAIRLVDQALDDGRRVLERLQSVATRFLRLEQAVLSLQDEFRFAVGVEFRILVVGKTRALNEVVKGEIYRIIREAVVNALRHSGATIIEVDLVYHRRVIRVAIRDNGCGFDLDTIQLARHPHLGLRGMSERADRIGAQLLVWSRSGTGTEIEISIPACSRSDTSTAIRGESIAS